MKLYIIAGEASGDLHASALIRELKKKFPAAEVRGFGGDRMAQEGAVIVKHYRELAFMGFLEVALNIRVILRNLSFCKKDILEFKPDAVILVDYPGFNLRMAQFLKENGIRVFYYISPQVWAWKASRVHTIKKYVDRMFVILPFEKAFYAKWNYEVDFVGHPLPDALAAMTPAQDFFAAHQLEHKRIIALLPGSRRQEIKNMLPVMLEMSHHFPGYQFVIAGLSQIGEGYYRQYIHHPHVKLVMDATYDLLNNAYAALVTSGTATVETALFNVPQVVCYKGSPLSFYIGRMLVQVPFIAMVNLICEKKVVEELLQNDLHEQNLKRALTQILDSKERERMFSDYALFREKLGGAGASAKTAALISDYMKK